MSKYENSLSGKLQQIYDIKGEIAEVIGTNSTDFSEYPGLIGDAIKYAGGGGDGESVDPFYDAANFYPEMTEETVPYYWSKISYNLQYTENYLTGEVSQINWDEEAYDQSGNGNTYMVHVAVQNDPHGLSGHIGQLRNDFLNYNSYFTDGNVGIYPILSDVTVTASSDPQKDGFDYLVAGDLYALNLTDVCYGVQDITENGFYECSGNIGVNVDVQGGGLEPGSESWIINGIEVAELSPGGGGNFWTETSIQPWDVSGVLNNSTTFDEYMHFINLIDLNFTGLGIDPTQFVSNAGQWIAYDNNGVVVSDLYCVAMVNPNYTSYQWCHVTGTLQNDTRVKFTLDGVSWDGMSWIVVGNEADLEIMPIVTYDYQNDTKSVEYTGTYIELPAGDIDMYFQYVPGDMGDPDWVEVYVATLDGYDNLTKRYVKISDTELTFYDPNAL